MHTSIHQTILQNGLIAVLLFALVPLASAQSVAVERDPCMGRLGRAQLTEVTTTANYFQFYAPGEATVLVNVEGAVQRPGLYEIGVGNDLGRLLALSGGPLYSQVESNREKRVEVRLFRPGRGPEPIYATLLQDTATNPDVYPPLCEGDTMLIDVIEKRGFGWQEVGIIAGGLSAVAFIVQALTN